MGFMDKAKKLAEQAQQKLDEAQTQFNQSASPQGGEPQGGGVQYDNHGRPVQQEAPPAPPPGAPPAADAPPSAPPASEAPAAPPPAAPPAPAADVPTAEQPEVTEQPQPPSETGDANPTPDPFKPLQQ